MNSGAYTDEAPTGPLFEITSHYPAKCGSVTTKNTLEQ